MIDSRPRRTLFVSVSARFFTSIFVVALTLAAPQAMAATAGGTVVDPTGAPVSGAVVSVESPLGVVATATTDSSGNFTIDGVAPGEWLLRVLYPGLLAAPQPLTLTAEGTPAINVMMRLSAITDAVVVSASQVEGRLSTSPSAITIFTEQDLAVRQFDSSAELLRLTPGMNVTQTGGRDGLTSVFPRGGEADYTLVLVDGIRVNSLGGAFDYSLLPIADIERIEIVRGPHSAVFGADAIGGVVQVVSRSGGPTRASGLVEGGSQSTARGVASVAGSVEGFAWGFSGERAASDGFAGTAANGETVTNDDSSHGAATLNLRYATPRWSAGTQMRLVETERGFPGPYGSDPNGTYGGVDRIARGENEHRTIGAQASILFASQARVRGSLSFADLDGRFDGSFGPSFSETQRVDGRVQFDAAFGQRLGLTGGTEMLGERGRNTYITSLSPTEPVPIRRHVTGVFVEGRYTPGTRLTLSGGLRVEHITRLALDGDFSRPTFEDDSVVSANPRAAVSWFAREAKLGAWSWTRLRGSAGTGIRPPDAFDIAFTDNPELKPERSRSFDVGVEQALFGASAVIEATWFHNNYDDLIVAVGQSFQDASRYRTDNIANARARGLEFALSLRPQTWLTVRAGYTYLDTEVLAVDGQSGSVPPPFSPGDDLLRRPPHAGWIEGVAAHARGSAFIRFGARGQTLDVDPSFGTFGGKLEAPGYKVTDLGGTLTLWRGISAFARVTNVFNRSYEEAFGFPSPERMFTGGVRLAAGR